MVIIKINDFVMEYKNRLGVGKYKGENDGIAIIEYFTSGKKIETKLIPVKRILRVSISHGTKCYVSNGNSWSSGKFAEETTNFVGDKIYKVRLFNGTVQSFDTSRVYVRCSQNVDNPVDILSCMGQEKAEYAEIRNEFIQSLTSQKNVVRGIVGLISSKINLLPHQVETVRRIMDDPVQRYLLCDEVGLGKTIEVGIVIRQFLIDYTDQTIVVVVPPSLMHQWKTELKDKFSCIEGANRNNNKIYFLSSEDIGKIQTCIRNNVAINAVIIDEAHHIASAAFSSDLEKRNSYNTYKLLAKKTERIFLLSATPVFNNEKSFLGMLHLLDPIMYRLEDLNSFRTRVNKRSDIGMFLLRFRENSTRMTLRKSPEDLMTLFSGDKKIAEWAELLTQNMTNFDENRDSITEIIRTIRTYITEVYRIHRRMIRHRRESDESNAQDNGYQSVLRSGIRINHDFKNPDQDMSERIITLIEDWRICLQGGVAGELCHIEDAELAFIVLLEGWGTSYVLLKTLVHIRLGFEVTKYEKEEFDPKKVECLQRLPRLKGETDILKNLLNCINLQLAEYDRTCMLSGMLYSQQQQGCLKKHVVFCSFTSVAKAIHNKIRDDFGDDAVSFYNRHMSQEELEENLARFKNSSTCFVFICDQIGEEGINLQFADVLIHYDLPWDVNRIEQRIGRFDRIGREHPFESRVLVGPNCEFSYNKVWFYALKTGFKVFEESVASLQFYLQQKSTQLSSIIFSQGIPGLEAVVPIIVKEIEIEKGNINNQDKIDVLESSTFEAEEFYLGLSEVEKKEQHFKNAMRKFFTKSLEYSEQTQNGIFCKYIQPLQTSRLNSRLRAELVNMMEIPGTYSRKISQTSLRCRLFRIGDEVVDFLNQFIYWDDQGRAFAIWRKPAQPLDLSAEWKGFRFNFIVEADKKIINSFLDQNELDYLDKKFIERRTEYIFPPFSCTLFLRADMEEEEDEVLLNVLNQPYNPDVDKDLIEDQAYLIKRAIGQEWAVVCQDAFETAMFKINQNKIVAQKLSDGCKEAKRSIDVRVNKLMARIPYAGHEKYDIERDCHIEDVVGKAIEAGVKNPCIKVDSVGFIILSDLLPGYKKEYQHGR